MALPVLILCCLSLLGVADATLLTTGTTVTINNVPYYLPGSVAAVLAAGSIPNGQESVGLVPITVINSSDVTAATAGFSSDDVWQPDFLQGIIIQTLNSSSAPSLYPNSSTLTVYFATTSLPNGPYVLDTFTSAVYQAWRLYSDFEGAFTETTIPNADGTFSVLPATIPGQSLAVAVPSRLYYTATPDKPLAGVRLGIKDIYDVAGVKTSDGNRAWYNFYPPATANSVPVQRLVDAGAIVVGKMKTSQFANGETATADWVDYHEPFNPRGDGYQDTSSSSSGPGAAQGAYPWLDISLGSDTGGSIRGPSGSQGLFGNRPTHGLVSLDGVMPLAPELDTAGFLTRDPGLWRTASSVLYGGLNESTSFPKEILTVSYPTNTSTPANAALVSFLNALANFLGGATVTPYNLTSSFADTAPAEAPTNDLGALLNITYPILISKEQTRLVRDPFYAAYAAANDGRRPFVDPAPLVRWGYGDAYPSSAIDEAVANKTAFQEWFESNVLVPTNDSSCSDKLLLYVGSSGGTTYRNVYRSAPTVPFGFSSGRISVFSEAPDFVVPVGEATYNSTVTGHEEVLPVAVDIMAARGCDGMLFDLINALIEAGLVKVPVTGRSGIGGGDVLFRRGEEWQ